MRQDNRLERLVDRLRRFLDGSGRAEVSAEPLCNRCVDQHDRTRPVAGRLLPRIGEHVLLEHLVAANVHLAGRLVVCPLCRPQLALARAEGREADGGEVEG